METGQLLARRETCPGCGCPRSIRLLDLPFAEPPLSHYLLTFYKGHVDPKRLGDERYQLDRCEGCSLVFQRFVPDGDFLLELYDTILAANPDERDGLNRSRGLRVRQRYSHDVEQLIKYHGLPPSEISVMDFGAGYGMWLQMAEAYGCTVAATEISHHKSERARAAGWRMFRPEQLPTSSFHFINADQVFEHLLEPAEVIRQLAGALQVGGLLRICVPNGEGLEESLTSGDWSIPKGDRGSLNPVAPLEHINCFSHNSLVALGTRAGLKTFHYPLRQYLDPMERVRFVATALLHTGRRPEGTLVMFQRTE
ncbi:MAG: methyltransferase domain-containing protein [Actinobacteria bacterium]|nr:methyltransferase domain-containing protein [Actinomycetota bacterium]